jgi:HPt (histidine-containing phosphotransfer) domain-containing protein
MTVSHTTDTTPPALRISVAEDAATTPDIDLAAALAMMNHQPRYLARMVRAALKTLTPSLEQALQNQARGDLIALEAVAHQMKGALAALVAKAAAESARELENAARSGEAGAAAQALAALETKTRALLPALEAALRPGGLAWTGDNPT